MSHAYTEDDQLVEPPVIGLLADFGWKMGPVEEEVLGTSGTLRRMQNTQEVHGLLTRGANLFACKTRSAVGRKQSDCW